jgi:ankyrin repeat protein
MWEGVDERDGDERQAELKEYFWQDMIEKGAKALKFMGTPESAHEIVDNLRSPTEHVEIPDIQRESLDDRTTLLESSAGHVIYEDIKEKLEHYGRSITRLQEEHAELEQEIHSGPVYEREEKEEDIRELKNQERRLIDEREQLHGLLRRTATGDSATSVVISEGCLPGQELETDRMVRPTLWMREDALRNQPKSGVLPFKASRTLDTHRLKSLQQHNVTEMPNIRFVSESIDELSSLNNKSPKILSEVAYPQDYPNVIYETKPEHRTMRHGGKNPTLDQGSRRTDIHSTNEKGETLLHWAAENGLEQLAEFLITAGVDINASTVEGVTALHQASRNGSKPTVKLLIKKQADVKATTESSETALHLAAEHGHAEVAKILITSGSDINAQNIRRETALHWAVSNGHMEVTRLLLKMRAEVDAKTVYDATALHWSVASGYDDIAQLLTKEGNVNAKASRGEAALHWAVENGRETMVKQLLQKGADVNVTTANGMTPIHLAARNGFEEIAELLIKSGARVDMGTSNNSQTALHWAVKNGHLKVVQILLDNGALINEQDKTGRTALHRAAEKGDEEMVVLLLDRGADLHAHDKNYRTALDGVFDNKFNKVWVLLDQRTRNQTIM